MTIIQYDIIKLDIISSAYNISNIYNIYNLYIYITVNYIVIILIACT